MEKRSLVLFALCSLFLISVDSKKMYISFKLLGTSSISALSSNLIAQNLQNSLAANTYNGPYKVYNYTVHMTGGSTGATTTGAAGSSTGNQATSTSADQLPSSTSPSSKVGISSFLTITFISAILFGRRFQLSLFIVGTFWILLSEGLSGYDHCKVLDEDAEYQLNWKIDGQQINFAIQAKTDGWMALGVSQNGKMNSGGNPPGSDIFLGYHGADCPNGCVMDYSTEVYDKPLLDAIQNLEFVKSTKLDGILTLEFRRNLTSFDKKADLSIDPSVKTHMIWAVNSNEMPSNRESFSKHDHRGSIDITFSQASMCPSRSDDILVEFVLETDMAHFDRALFASNMSKIFGFEAERVSILDVHDIEEPYTCTNCREMLFQYKKFSVPTEETFYACMGVEFPEVSDHSEHIIRFETLVDNAKVLHHLVVYTLAPGSTPYSSTPVPCNMPNANLIYAWGPGGAPVDLPQEAGFKIGGANGVRYAVLNFHYNNPTNTPGMVDSSGVRMYSTPVLRKHDAGLLFLGVELNSINIPKNHPTWHMSGGCPNWATKLLTESLVVFSQFSHMHYLGRRMWTEHYRQGKLIGNLGNTTNYDFNNQFMVNLNETIEPKDEMITHCVYDSTGKNSTTTGGEASNQEMCFNIISYYPAIDAFGCSDLTTPACDCDMNQPCLNQPQCTNNFQGCSKHQNCSSCSADASCGWCNSPAVIKCIDKSQQQGCTATLKGTWNNCNQAPATSCAAHKDCGSCNSDSANKCSWCFGTTVNPNGSNCLATAAAASVCESLGGFTMSQC